MRAQGALAQNAVPVLETHLATCESCRDHAASMIAVDAALAPRDDQAPPAPRWEQIEERLQAGVRRYRRRAPWVIVISGAGAVAAMSVLHALLDRGPMRVATMAAVLALYLTVMGIAYRAGLRWQQRLLDRSDVVAAYREELERRLRVARAAQWMWPLVVLLELPSSVHQLAQIFAGNPHAPARLAIGALLIGCALTASVMAIVTARTTRRELAGLR